MNKKNRYYVGVFALEMFLIGFMLFFNFSPFVLGEVGENATVVSYLEIGNVYPEILNISVDNYASEVILIGNSTKEVYCQAIIRDFNNETNFDSVYAEFYNSSWGGSDDNNYHYTNNSCDIVTEFGTWNGISDSIYTALANCTFDVLYYSNPGEWNCTMVVTDDEGLNATGDDNVTMAELLSVGLPTSINYGIINATYVSGEEVADVTNYGNVEIDVAISGYAISEGDGLAMNCTLGSLQNISIEYEKYNVSDSTSGSLSLTEFENNYINLTESPVTEDYNLAFRQDDVTNEAYNSTYWRIYVPTGVAGTCQGNIVFGAVKS